VNDCYLQLSKIGDILGILPILYHRFKETGQKQNLVISKKYSDIIEGCSYVEPVIFEGNHGDLKEAIKFAKQKFDSVTVLQCHCRDFQIQHKTPSFQLDQWLRGNCIEHFGEWPLVFDQRSNLQERILRDNTIKRGQKYILIADHSESSPFPQIDELIEMVKKEFGANYQIIKLSEIKAYRFINLLGLYDKAAALISIETAHIHLSAASKVPVFVLATDGWRGSAYQERFKFYCRYAEWSNQKTRLLNSIFNSLNEIAPIKITHIKTVFLNGYNLSSIKWGDKILRCYRYHPNQNNWFTKLAIDDKPIVMPDSIKSYSHEDARFFVSSGKLYLSYTLSRAQGGEFSKSVVGYGELVQNTDGWKIDNHIQLLVPELTPMGNKNFVFFESDHKLYFIYGIKDKHQIVYEINKDKISTEHKTPEPKWNWGGAKGGCLLPHKDGFLRFFHSRMDYSKTSWRYFIGASLMENKSPFRTTAISSYPILQGNELYTPNWRHWKSNVTIPFGVIQNGDKFELSVGLNDSKCAVAELSEKDLKL
jgi:predicted GH43/DUF377 family glycosyl hydrolase